LEVIMPGIVSDPVQTDQAGQMELIRAQQALKSREQFYYATFATGGAIAGWLVARKLYGKDWVSLGGLIGSLTGALINYLRVQSSYTDTSTTTTTTII
jgi:hypothetical protein